MSDVKLPNQMQKRRRSERVSREHISQTMKSVEQLTGAWYHAVVETKKETMALDLKDIGVSCERKSQEV